MQTYIDAGLRFVLAIALLVAYGCATIAIGWCLLQAVCLYSRFIWKEREHRMERYAYRHGCWPYWPR